MIRIPILIIALYLSIVSAFAQSKADSLEYRKRKLSFEEANFVTSYYHQDGNNAAVTGGVGSEKLTDFATTFDVHLKRYDSKNRIHDYTVELGVDTYTSASSDKVNPNTVSSASSQDVRVYPSVSWLRTDEKKGNAIGANFAVSSEYDYLSIGGGLSFYKDSKDNNRQVGVKLQTYQDLVTLIYPIEMRSGRDDGMKSRNTYNAGFTLSQIMNTRWQVLFLVDLAYQEGYLSLPFNRVYFDDSSADIEKLPDTRFKIPVGVRASYFLGDRVIIKGFYRYYHDSWGIDAHTAEIELPIKITPFFSITPHYRYYNQTAADYFAPYQQHQVQDNYYTSDYDLSSFSSNFAGIGFRVISPEGLLGIQKFNSLELRYGHYDRETGLVSNIISLHARFK